MIQWGCDFPDRDVVECCVGAYTKVVYLYKRPHFIMKAEAELPKAEDIKRRLRFPVRPTKESIAISNHGNGRHAYKRQRGRDLLIFPTV